MDALLEYQQLVLRGVDSTFSRYLFADLPWHDRFLCIKGLRGVGKTTMLLQHLKFNLGDTKQNLYVSLDHPYFFRNSLDDLAKSFVRQGGKVLLVDEVHKLQEWASQIKMIFDTLPELQVVFTSSSALDLLQGQADLSRRVVVYQLSGMSFREFLLFYHQVEVPRVTFTELLTQHKEIAEEVLSVVKPIPAFQDYLHRGYYPFSKDQDLQSFRRRLMQTLETTLNVDLAIINDFSAENNFKIKKLLGVVAESPPFSINISKIAERLEIGRNTVKSYLHALEKAGVLNFLNREGKGISILQKPDKIYIENPNLAQVIRPNPDIGNLRESFALNQLINADYAPQLPRKDGDIYLSKQDVLLEIGGPGKTYQQIKGLENAYVFSDDLEVGYHRKIPLYLLGLLY